MVVAVKPKDNNGTRILTGLVPALYDTVNVTYPSSTVEVYTFIYQGTTVAVVTLTYNGSNQLVSAERTA